MELTLKRPSTDKMDKNIYKKKPDGLFKNILEISKQQMIEFNQLDKNNGQLSEKGLSVANASKGLITVQLLSSEATVPQKATCVSAGFDIFAAENVLIDNDGKYVSVKTGIMLKIPYPYYGKISCRSGLAVKNQVFAFEGTIDSDYQQELIILLRNVSDVPYQISVGDRIAQIVFIRIHYQSEMLVSTTMKSSTRGGFGSTGK